MAHASELIATDIEGYLHAHQHKSLLRFITCGSVDDGKSTLIGRMLYESHLIFEDHLDALEADFRANRYFDVTVEYAKASPEDILCRITAVNRGPDAAPLRKRAAQLAFESSRPVRNADLPWSLFSPGTFFRRRPNR